MQHIRSTHGRAVGCRGVASETGFQSPFTAYGLSLVRSSFHPNDSGA